MAHPCAAEGVGAKTSPSATNERPARRISVASERRWRAWAVYSSRVTREPSLAASRAFCRSAHTRVARRFFERSRRPAAPTSTAIWLARRATASCHASCVPIFRSAIAVYAQRRKRSKTSTVRPIPSGADFTAAVARSTYCASSASEYAHFGPPWLRTGPRAGYGESDRCTPRRRQAQPHTRVRSQLRSATTFKRLGTLETPPTEPRSLGALAASEIAACLAAADIAAL